jgi:hypothetical protein
MQFKMQVRAIRRTIDCVAALDELRDIARRTFVSNPGYPRHSRARLYMVYGIRLGGIVAPQHGAQPATIANHEAHGQHG